MDQRKKVNLHLPAGLHRRLKLLAAAEGVSMQKVIEMRLERFVWKDGDVRITRPTGRRAK